MPCTTLLVGKNASYDGSTMMDRNADSGAGSLRRRNFLQSILKNEPDHIGPTCLL
jgi:Dipeptidase